MLNRFLIKSSKADDATPLYVADFNACYYEDVEWTTHIENAYLPSSEAHAIAIVYGLKDNGFPVKLVRRWWWFGWHEEEVKV